MSQESIATAAVVTPADVTLDKIETISSRRGSDRHLLTDSLRVDTIVKVSDESAAVSMASALTQDKINSELQKAGLPKVTMLEAPKAATVGPSQDNQQKTSNNSTIIAAVVSTVVVVTVLLAGALFWRHRPITKPPEPLVKDSEQSDSTHVMDICEHNRLKITCQLCREHPDPEIKPHTPDNLEEVHEDSHTYNLLDQNGLDEVLLNIRRPDTKNTPVWVSVIDVDRGMTPHNFDARGETKTTKVQNLVHTYEAAAVTVSVDHGLVVRRRELESLSAELVPSFRERQLAFAAQTSTSHGRTVSSVPMLFDEIPAVEQPLLPAGSESIQPA